MPLPPAVRGLRRAELVSTDPQAAAVFYQELLGWRIWEADADFDCWVGDRRCAAIHPESGGRAPGWQLFFAGAPHRSELVGPDEVVAQLVSGRAQHGPWAPGPRSGEPRWAELCTADDARADDFWTATLGCSLQDSLYCVRDRPLANRTDRAVDGRWGWMCHFAVEEFDTAGERVLELGGKVLEQVQHPVLGDVVYLADPTGGVCALARSTGGWG